MSNKLMILAVFGIFLAGAGTLQARGDHWRGGGQDWHGKGHFGTKVGKRMITHMRNRLSEKLDLTQEQEQKVQVILEAKAEATKALIDEMHKKRLAIRDEGVAEIKSFLDKDQARKLDRLAARMERRRAEHRELWSGANEDSD